ncbi:hypothetical protein GCM10011490_07850 [Pseudoclavibacter endophyticus]|uniref:DUF2848 family protein n=1 Tax=Pseudoclavibacter endophyticus TaxID=1778590 RepID=UPI001664187E|nr:DUF2848 family protein [Pseudoclavibacter endophyticus]GGA60124.1 hypothetical protein GCM10011490_07850 [Pseudoclavibacter endophyticus]
MTTASALTTIDDLVDPATTTCLVIGYAARNAVAVQEHIDELEAIGVAPPPEVPMVYRMSPGLLTASPRVSSSATSSGEVEPVLVRSGGRHFLGVGSDHTDRVLEAEDVLRSKLACPKPVGAQFVEIDLDTFDWDACSIGCQVDGREYQAGRLDSLRTPTNLFGILAERGAVAPGEDAVVFGGTVPLLDGGFVYGTSWTVSLTLPDGRAITHTYEITED